MTPPDALAPCSRLKLLSLARFLGAELSVKMTYRVRRCALIQCWCLVPFHSPSKIALPLPTPFSYSVRQWPCTNNQQYSMPTFGNLKGGLDTALIRT